MSMTILYKKNYGISEKIIRKVPLEQACFRLQTNGAFVSEKTNGCFTVGTAECCIQGETENPNIMECNCKP